MIEDFVELTEEEIINKIETNRKKDVYRLDLGEMKLSDLGCLRRIKEWPQLEVVNLVGNDLHSIDILNNFPNIKILLCSKNFIISTVLQQLKKLEVLDLSYNNLDQIPDLRELVKLEELNLKNNEIKKLNTANLTHRKDSLIKVDLSENYIDFDDSEYDSFLSYLAKMTNIKVFNIYSNWFCEHHPKYEFDIATRIPLLEKVNNKDAEPFKTEQTNLYSVSKKAQTVKGVCHKFVQRFRARKNREKQLPDLETLNNFIEEAGCDPTKCLHNLELMSAEVEKILQDVDRFEKHIIAKHYPSIANELIENFLQNIQLLLENQHKLQVPILRIVAKLSIIKFSDFGIRCLNSLEDFMTASRPLKKNVIQVLKSVVIPKLKEETVEKVQPALVEGLTSLVQNREIPSLLFDLIPCYKKWLAHITPLIKRTEDVENEKDWDLHDKIFGLMAATVQRAKNAAAFRERDLLKDFTILVNHTNHHFKWQRYISLLNVIKDCAINDPECATQMTKYHTMHFTIRGAIQETLHFYKRNNDLVEEDKDQDIDVKHKYMVFAAQIHCFAGLLNTKFAQNILDIAESETTKELLAITAHYKTDPLILTAICQLALNLLQQKKVKDQPQLMEHYVKRMQKLHNLLPYLNGKKYQVLCEMGERYQTGTLSGKDAIKISLLTNPVIHKLFIVIIKLINYFCEESVKKANASYTIMEDVSKALNENQRESYLFECLEVPNDDVKLSVVECLNKVPMNELETDEIGHLVRMLGSYKNLGAGRTEEVLAKIFWILIKLAKAREEEPGKIFRSKYAELAISECLDILRRNQERTIDNAGEAGEKEFLSISCVLFLEAVSGLQDLRHYLTFNTLDDFKKILYAEENYTNFVNTPIQIENSWIGRNIEYLLQTTTGYFMIVPYYSVSLRIIQRIADVLQDKPEVEIENPFDEEESNIMPKIINEISRDRQRKVAKELKAWGDPPKNFLQRLEGKSSQLVDHFKQQHKVFSSSKGIDRILMFLTGRTSLTKGVEIEKYLSSLCENKYKSANLLDEMQNVKEKFEGEEEKRQEEVEEAKKKHTDTLDEDDSYRIGSDLLKMALQKEPLGMYSERELVDRGISHTVRNFDTKTGLSANVMQGVVTTTNGGTPGENMTAAGDDEEGETPGAPTPGAEEHFVFRKLKGNEREQSVYNKNYRSLVISAMLRCIYASIEYSPTLELKDQTISQLRVKQTFTWLTELCSTTGWVIGNVGAKYLRIVQHALALSPRKSESSPEDLDLYEIVCIALKEMLEIMFARLKDEEKMELDNEDKVFIKELSRCGSLICKQCSTFTFSTMTVTGQTHNLNIRTPQEKAVEHLLKTLIPFHYLYTYITILFYAVKVTKIQGIDKVDAGEFRGGEETRECVTTIFGEYLNICRLNKYKILEAIMKSVIFEKKVIRPSTIQQILNYMKDSGYRIALENYMRNNNMLQDEDSERILLLSWCEMAEEGKPNYFPRLFVLTNAGLYLFKRPSSKPCRVCPIEKFCPSGPRLEHKYAHSSIIGYIDFIINQQMVITLKKGGYFSSEQEINYIVIFPEYNKKKEVLSYLNVLIPKKDRIYKDKIIEQAFEKDYKKHRDIQFVSLNPKKGWSIMNLFKDDPIINNCTLAAITEKEVAFFKHDISAWFFYEEENPDKEFTEEEEFDIDALGGPAQNEGFELQNKDLEKRILATLEKLLILEHKENIADLDSIEQGTSKEPSLRLNFKGNEYYLYFQCDFGLQTFLKALTEVIGVD